jgi:hypothetical protein
VNHDRPGFHRVTPWIAVLLLLGSSGCQSLQPLYHWGSYEPLTYAALTQSENVSPEEQLLLLEQDLEIARAKDRSPPPGMLAYMGYLCLSLGEDERGLAYMELEQQFFPESAPFLDRLLNTSNRQPSDFE